MYRFSQTGINFKIFVKEANGGEKPPEKADPSRKHLPIGSLTGDKAKEFYEEVLKNPSLSSRKGKNVNLRRVSRPPSKAVQSKTFKSTDLLWMAQNNDVKNMKAFFAQNKSDGVNVVDDFGWTPLMCASCSGAQNAVSLLLENGGDPEISDKFGETALSLARRKNRRKIVEMLEAFKSKPGRTADDEGVAEGPKASEVFFCSTCKGNFETDKNKHESSTVHLFNRRVKTSTFYGIPESNKGFQLLLREGWDKEKGLGRDGTGRKFPVKAVMKNDRTGIGGTPPERSGKRGTQKLSESKRGNERLKGKDFEKNFRLEFS